MPYLLAEINFETVGFLLAQFINNLTMYGNGYCYIDHSLYKNTKTQKKEKPPSAVIPPKDLLK